MLIGVIGDATLDVTVGPPGPMSAGDARAHITLGPGGQGANVAVRLARAGLRVRLIAPLADDAAGRVLRAHLESEALEIDAVPASRTSMVVVLVASGGARTMLSDRTPFAADLAESLAGCEWVQVSGYALREQAEADCVVGAIRAVGARPVSVAGGSFEDLLDAGVARNAIDEMGTRLLVVNRDEAGLLVRDPLRTIGEAASALATPDRLAVVTNGEHGAAAAAGWIPSPVVRDAQTLRGSAIDSTGAGDAFTASLIASLASGWPPDPDALASALEVAAREGAAATTAIGAQSVGATRSGGDV